MPSLSRPATGPITTQFGGQATPSSPPHKGTDFGYWKAAPDLRVFAALTAPIVYSGPATKYGVHSDYGNIAVQRWTEDGATWEAIYAHLPDGEQPSGPVEAGQHITRMGLTGKTTGTHLHFELRRNGVPLNPENYFISTAGADVTPFPQTPEDIGDPDMPTMHRAAGIDFLIVPGRGYFKSPDPDWTALLTKRWGESEKLGDDRNSDGWKHALNALLGPLGLGDWGSWDRAVPGQFVYAQAGTYTLSSADLAKIDALDDDENAAILAAISNIKTGDVSSLAGLIKTLPAETVAAFKAAL